LSLLRESSTLLEKELSVEIVLPVLTLVTIFQSLISKFPSLNSALPYVGAVSRNDIPLCFAKLKISPISSIDNSIFLYFTSCLK
jgi:hypothetical protein